MRLFERYRHTPPSATGRARHDPTLSLANAAISGLLAASAAVRRIPAPGGADSTIALTVERRRIVARDQDVIELTLAPGRGSKLPR